MQAAFSYTTGPVYTTEYYRNYAKQLEEMGANSICIKDMAGLLKPYEAYELVRTLKESVKIPIQLHTHYTSGLASMTLMKAVEAGSMSSTPRCPRWRWEPPSRPQSPWSPHLPEPSTIPVSTLPSWMC